MELCFKMKNKFKEATIKMKKQNKITKSISLLEISIMIIATFAFAYLVAIPELSLVSAEVTSCCERTTSGAWCQNAPSQECASNYQSTPTSCESTSYCKLGCCYDSQEGLCMENTPEIVCSMNNGTWADSASCAIPQCNLGCCVLNGQAAFTTLTRCKKLSSFYAIATDFRNTITSEIQCLSVASLEDKGACVYDIDYATTCKYTTRSDCNDIDAKKSSGTSTLTSATNFYKDKLCSAEDLATNCGPTEQTTCHEGKVYFLDSCGNIANIYDSSRIKDKVYWDKKISASESCNAGESNANSASCGNCEYLLGSRCGSSSLGAKATYGDYICRNLNCNIDGKEYKHGESWCSTDKYQDSVGSRYFRHICSNGEEIIEPCSDFRNQVCTQGKIETSVGDFLQGACTVNRWQDCTSQEDEDDCLNTDKRDCSWTSTSSSVSNTTIGCVPLNPPGFKFWETEAETICSQATTSCVITYEKGLLGGTKCVENCHCESPSWQAEQQAICQSLGDCGSKINYIGVQGKAVTTSSGKQASTGTFQNPIENNFNNPTAKLFLPIIQAFLFLISDIKLVEAMDYYVYYRSICSGEYGGTLSTRECDRNTQFQEKSWREDGSTYYCCKNKETTSTSNNPASALAPVSSAQVVPPATTPSSTPQKYYSADGSIVEITKVTNGFKIDGGETVTQIPEGHTLVSSKLATDAGLTVGGSYAVQVGDAYQTGVLTSAADGGSLLLVDSKAKTIETITGAAGATTFAEKATENPAAQGALAKFFQITNPQTIAIINGLQQAITVGAAVYMFGTMMGLDQSLTNALSLASSAGMMANTLVKTFRPEANAGAWGVGVGILVFILTYKKEETKTVTFDCYSFEAPIGGRDCEKCNNDDLGCSEYRCKSLGQACQLLNVGTAEERCAWVNPKDVTSPKITPWEEVLTKEHVYTPDNTIRPNSIGVRIENEKSMDTCLKAFSPITFGITTDEPTQCKIDYNYTSTFEQMKYFMSGSSLYAYNHTETLNLPSPEHLEASEPLLKHDGKYNLFIRCKDANGNYNIDEFAVSFCVEKGPDISAPVIVETNPTNEAPVQYDLPSIAVTIFVNEPSDCKWSRLDSGYDNLENNMLCYNQITQQDSRGYYRCIANLTGIENRKDNLYYFKCQDLLGNQNRESYIYKLKGSSPLDIVKSSPDDMTISGSSNVIPVDLQVETSNGESNRGYSTCYFSRDNVNFVEMFETGSNIHKQRQDLPTGDYDYYFRCVDLGGNSAESSINFNVYVDNEPPLIARLYRDSSRLKLVTNENSTCYYSLNSEKNCNFLTSEGIVMRGGGSLEHYAEWQDGKTYYIKCEDMSGNQPLNTKCSITVNMPSV
jgi:hypothetical protein